MATYPASAIYRPKRSSMSVAAPTVEPVTLEEAKAHLRVDTSDEDATIYSQIIAARGMVETMLNRALITRTHTWKLDKFPVFSEQVLELPGGKLQSVTSIQYVDGDGVTQTWASSNYDVDTAHVPGRVALAYGASWPAVREWNLPITITYEAGYGSAQGDIPASVTQGLLLLVADMFENRQQNAYGAPVATAIRARDIFAGERVFPAINYGD